MNTEITPEFIMLIGLPASGKSTYIKSKTGYVIISTDDIIQSEADKIGKTYSEVFKDMIGLATTIANAQFRDAIRDKKNIIWDQTNVSAKKRINVLRQVPKYYHKTANVFTAPLDVLKERLIKRGQETGKHIPFGIVVDMQNRFEMPTEAEGFDEIKIIGELC